MKKVEKEDLFWFVHDLAKKEMVSQTDLPDGSSYSQGWIDACNIIMKRINGVDKD